jgi:hypothetical protein
VSFPSIVDLLGVRKYVNCKQIAFEGLMLVNITSLFLDVGDGNWNLQLLVFYSYSTCLRSVSCLDVSATSVIGHGVGEDSLSVQLDVWCIKLVKVELSSTEYCVALNWYLACYMASLAICHPYIASISNGLGVTAFSWTYGFLLTRISVTLSNVAVGEAIIACSWPVGEVSQWAVYWAESAFVWHNVLQS